MFSMNCKNCNAELEDGVERCPVCGMKAGSVSIKRSIKKMWITIAVASAIVLTLAISLVLIVPGGILRQSSDSSAANASEPLRDLFYVRNGALCYTSIDSISPKEIVQYDLPPQWRTVFAIQVSEDGRRFFYPKDIDNTKPNYCADIYCYDLMSKNPEALKVGSDINNYTINQDGSKIFYLKDKTLYVSDLADTDKIAANVCRFYIDKKGDRLIYETFDGRLVQYTVRKAAKDIGPGVVLQYVSADLNTVYYLKGDSLYLLKNGKNVSMIASGVVSVSNIYADGSLYYLKKNPANTLKSLYYYSDGRSAKISGYCDYAWSNEDHRTQTVLNSDASYCGSDGPLLVYSQPADGKADASDGAGPAELYACSGSKVLGKIGDKKPIRVEYDNINNKIYYAIDHSKNQFLYDLYCVAIDGETAFEVRKYAEDVSTGDILFGGNVVFIKSESNFGDGDLYVNNLKTDSFSNILNWWTNSANAFTYMGNISKYDHTFTLKLYQDEKVTKLANDVTFYMSYHFENKLAYLVRKGKRAVTGQLYLYDGAQAGQQIDTEVNAIIAPLGNQYYSFWDDQPTYDIE